MNVEKNDVDISKLFNWGTVFEYGLPDAEIKDLIYMRLVGDEDMNRARVYALRNSRLKRRTLLDDSTDDNIALIPESGEYTVEQLLNMIAMFSMRDITRDAVRQVKVKIPKSPSEDAPLEEQEEYQYRLDSYNTKLESKRLKFVNKKISEIKDRLKSIPEDEIYTTYRKKLVDEFCEVESLNSLKEALVYFGTFRNSDYTDKYFDSIEQIRNLPSKVKIQFITAYQSIEIGGEELKKLRGATQ